MLSADSSEKELIMAEYQNLKFETKNQIAYITIDRPKVLNALNMATMQELKDAFASIKEIGRASCRERV